MIVLATSVLMLVLVLSGLWTGPALVIAGALGLWLSYGTLAPLQIGAMTWKLANTADLAIIPLFMVMGELLAGSRSASDLFNWIMRFRRLTPAAPALATVVLGTMIAAVCGSIAAVTAICTRTAYGRLLKEGLPIRQSIGLVASVGSLGIMVPPSIILIVYGTMTETSILNLYKAALVPSLIQIVLFFACAIGIWYLRAAPVAAPEDQAHNSDGPISAAWQFPCAIAIVVGGFISGVVTPTESGALGALLALVLSIINGEISWKLIRTATRNAVMATSMILLIVLGSEFIAATLAIQGFTRDVSVFIKSLPFPPFVLMIVVVLIYVVLGTVFEGLALMTLTVPFLFPAIIAMGYSPIWFGVLIVICIQIAELSPPIGVNLFVAQQYTGEKAEEVWQGVMPYLWMLVLMAILLIAFPGLGIMLL